MANILDAADTITCPIGRETCDQVPRWLEFGVKLHFGKTPFYLCPNHGVVIDGRPELSGAIHPIDPIPPRITCGCDRRINIAIGLLEEHLTHSAGDSSWVQNALAILRGDEDGSQDVRDQGSHDVHLSDGDSAGPQEPV